MHFSPLLTVSCFCLCSLSDASGSLELQLKAEGTFTKADLASDVSILIQEFIFD